MQANPISTDVNFDRDGVQHGHLKLPYSRDDSAWGAIMIPMTVVRNGAGPTALLTGGNHGDEYEGPVALFDLAGRLRHDDISGRVIIVPAMNFPAFRAAARTSPIDGGNMNRTFPGRSDGTITEVIADYFQRTMLPMSDYIVDIHSGGKTLDFLPLAAAHKLADNDQELACMAARDAFNAPWSMTLAGLDFVGLFDTACAQAGKIFLSTEMGGGGTSRVNTNRIAKRGVRNVLIHAGILPGEMEREPSQLLELPDTDCFVTSLDNGLIEPVVDLGERVAKGDPVARIFDINRTGMEPVVYRAGRDGIVAGRHHPGLVQTGDTIALVATVK